jgi:hypothetical protein
MEEEMVRVIPEPSVRIPGESDRPIRVGQGEFCCPIPTTPFCAPSGILGTTLL